MSDTTPADLSGDTVWVEKAPWIDRIPRWVQLGFVATIHHGLGGR